MLISIPFLALIIEILTVFNSKFERKSHPISKLLIIGYNFCGYYFIICERIALIPFSLIFFRAFFCGNDKMNFSDEMVVSGFKDCWKTSHLIFAIFTTISAIIYYITEFLYIYLYSFSYLKSPLPFSDEHILMRFIQVFEKSIIVIFLVFDSDVI